MYRLDITSVQNIMLFIFSVLRLFFVYLQIWYYANTRKGLWSKYPTYVFYYKKLGLQISF